MVMPTRARTRKRSEGAHLESRYFSVPAQERNKTRGGRDGHDVDSLKLKTQMCPLPSTTPTKSHFFQPKLDLDAILADPAFLLFYDDFISAMLELYYAKPLLIQDYVSHSPWKVLIAVTLVNKTAGAKAIPVFFDIIQRWPNPAALANAPFSLLFETLKDLGLGQIRSQRLIDISQAFIDHPPRVNKLYPSRGKHTAVFITSDGSFVLDQVKYPPTPISHIPGCGPYALDSYRIFCAVGDEWKAVRPTDKELVKYLQWRWAVEAYRKWDQTFGPGESIDLDYVRALTAALTSDSISRPC